MNTNHHPSLELCKKLTEIGFPTTFQHIGDSGGTIIGCGEIPEGMYVSPSVMEMLDVMPWELKFGETYAHLTIKRVSERNSNVCYSRNQFETGNFNGPLPNALAEMILWLHENKYITFPTP